MKKKKEKKSAFRPASESFNTLQPTGQDSTSPGPWETLLCSPLPSSALNRPVDSGLWSAWAYVPPKVVFQVPRGASNSACEGGSRLTRLGGEGRRGAFDLFIRILMSDVLLFVFDVRLFFFPFIVMWLYIFNKLLLDVYLSIFNIRVSVFLSDPLLETVKM